MPYSFLVYNPETFVEENWSLFAVAGDTCNTGELDLTGIDDEELDKVC